MATSSVDMPLSTDGEPAPPKILDRTCDFAVATTITEQHALGAKSEVDAMAVMRHTVKSMNQPAVVEVVEMTGVEDEDGDSEEMKTSLEYTPVATISSSPVAAATVPVSAMATAMERGPETEVMAGTRGDGEGEGEVPATGNVTVSTEEGTAGEPHLPADAHDRAQAQAQQVKAGAALSHPSSYHLRHTQSGRIVKPGANHHRSSASASSVSSSRLSATATAAATTTTTTTGTKAASFIAELAAAVAGPPQLRPTTFVPSFTVSTADPHSARSSMSTTSTAPKLADTSAPSALASTSDPEPPVFSFWGPEPVPLPSRFVRIKRNLIRGNEAELEAGWARLIDALRSEVEHIQAHGDVLVPSIEFADVDDPSKTTQFGRDLRRYGVGVVRKVLPKPDADAAIRDTVEYLDSKRHIKTLQHDPACFDFFWTPAQVRSRAHPDVLSAQRFMMGLWETSPDDRLVTRLPITYADRIRIHGMIDRPSIGADIQSPQPETPQSADEWISALQSSAGIIAQVDNGSLERWEPDGYQRAGTYDHVFSGRWEDYDPWECASRASTTSDLYNGYGACTIFRMFQGILALSTIEPGMIRLLPSPKLVTAYFLLRPFFRTRNPPPPSRSGPEWDLYLSPENWTLAHEPDSIIHGAVPGHAQRITEHWHPHLYLRSSMITLPTLQPGDYVFWHPDLAYHLSNNSPGLVTPNVRCKETSMLVYIPAAPLTQTNALYLARQRKAFQRGHPGPDFDSTGRGAILESADTRPGEREIAEAGGPAALQAMGLAPWEVAGTRAGTPPSDRTNGSDQDGDRKRECEDKSLKSTNSSSSAPEAEVVRLANIILFPDRSMMGYSV